MGSRRSFGRAAAFALIGSALGIALASAPAQAQCVGDCGGNGDVSISDLITGVNISLGSQPVSACPAFANSQGEVTIAQLITGVNNSLNGCPVTSPTPTVTPEAGLGNQTCTLLTETEPMDADKASHLQLGIALPVRLVYPLSGTINLSGGAVNEAGEADMSCTVDNINPVNIPSIGFVCITATAEPCPGAKIACDGGAPLDIDLRSDGNVGTCSGNAECATQCDAHCASIGSVRTTSGCTGYCSAGTEAACINDAACLPDNGACNGPDPVGINFDICQCQCVNNAVGDDSRPGDFQCNLGSRLVVENAAPCDGTDIRINVGSTCVALTTGTASTLISNANFTTDTVPAAGPADQRGVPVTCENYAAGDLTGLKIRGVVNFFGSALGDIATSLAADCSGPE